MVLAIARKKDKKSESKKGESKKSESKKSESKKEAYQSTLDMIDFEP